MGHLSKKLWSRDRVTVLLLVLTFTHEAQPYNYILNPSFEIINSSYSLTTTGGVFGWGGIDTIKGGFLPFTVEAPYFNASNSSYGFQMPLTGRAFIGTSFFCATCSNSSRLYPKNRLKRTLKGGEEYCGCYFIVNTNNTTVGMDSYGMLLGDSSIDTIQQYSKPLSYLAPQVVNTGGIITDTMNWTAVAGTFVATGNEKYALLGNFRPDSQTQTVVINPTYLPALVTDVYIDDVSIVPLNLPAFAGRDTNLLPGDSVFIGREPDVGLDYACQWYELPNDSVPIDTVAGLWVKPTKKTTYVVRQQLWCSGVKWDTVTIHFNMVGVGQRENAVSCCRISPNPTDGHVRISTPSEEDEIKLAIYDMAGACRRQSTIFVKAFSSTVSMPSAPGVYMLVGYSKKHGSFSKKVVVAR